MASLIEAFRDIRVWVVGDLMLDEYSDGDVQRVSPEAPVPVVAVGDTYVRLGGAANVAHGLAALGARVSLCGAIGQDAAGDQVVAICERSGIDIRAIGRSSRWNTARKQRVVAQRQQLLRLDWERQGVVGIEEVEGLIASLADDEAPQVIILSDYGKGVLTPATIAAMIKIGVDLGVPVLSDPNSTDLTVYRGASVVTPNRRELAAMVGLPLPEVDDPAFAEVARAQVAQAGIGALAVTLGEHGVLVVSGQVEACLIRSTSQEVYDVTGAGDTFIAVLALALACDADLLTAARIANSAAGVVVAKFGTAVVQPDELASVLAETSPRTSKIHSVDALCQQVVTWRRQGKRVAFTNGCFDVLHVGHLSLLRFASDQADVLVVGLNDDDSVRALKGAGRPHTVEAERSALVAALDCVDAVVMFSEDTPLRLIEQIRPDVLVKGSDYALADVVGRQVVEAGGGGVKFTPLVGDRSSARLIDKMKDS
jgi:D-beta-D-heptose 7-phosphate kinase/D-beta-D-heptose 1-phosphate adenosyltransferase